MHFTPGPNLICRNGKIMESHTRSNFDELTQSIHRTRPWSDLNAPEPGCGSKENRALRSLIKRKSKKSAFVTKLTVCIVSLLLLTATVAVTFNNSPDRSGSDSRGSVFAEPTDSKQLITRGEALVKMGRYEEALMDFACMLRLNRNSRRAQEGIALCYLEMGRNKEAIAKLNELLERNPDSISAHLMRGNCFLALKEFDQARSDFSWLLKHERQSPAAYCSMADLLSMEGKQEEALLYLDQAISIVPDKFEPRQGRADILVSLGRYHEATEEFEIINSLPDKQENFTTLSSRLKALTLSKDAQSSLAILNKLISLRPDQVTLYLERARAQAQLQNYSRAIKDCDAALKLSPGNCFALTTRASCHAKLCDQISAEQDYLQAVQKNPNELVAYLELAEFQMNRSQFASALETYRNALKVDSSSKTALAGRQKANQQLAQLAGPGRIASIQHPPGQAGYKELQTYNFERLLPIGYKALRQNNFDYACRALKRCVQLKPNSAEARRYLAYALIESGDLLAAEEQLIALKVLGHENSPDALRLAKAFQNAGQNDRAIALLKAHIRRHKCDADMIILLSDVLLASNEREQALELCQQAMTAVASHHDQLRLKAKYIALKNADVPALKLDSQRACDEAPADSQGS